MSKKGGRKGDKQYHPYSYRDSLKISSNRFDNKIRYVDEYFNRPIASLIVRAVYNTPITPNVITYVSFFIGLLGAFFFSRGEYQYFIWGGVLAQVSSVVDGADGMLARAKNLSTRFGAHLDLYFDRIIDFCLFLGVAIGAGTYYKDSHLLFLGTLFAGLYLLQVNLFYILLKFLDKEKTGESGGLRAIVILSLFLLAIFNRLDLAIYIGLTSTSLLVVLRTFVFIRLGRKA